MHVARLLANPEFADDAAHAEPVYVDDHSRVLCFALRPGQSVNEHRSPASPVHLVVLQGEALIRGGEGEPSRLGPGDVASFAVGERHSVTAGEEPVVLAAILHGAPSLH